MKNAIKVFCFVIAFIVLGTAGTYFFLTFDKGEFEYIDGNEKSTVVITNYIGSEKDVVIPKHLRFKKVTAIDEDAFRETNIESVVIKGNATKIGQNAFNGCKSLKSVKIEEGVMTLGEAAFFDCESLESVTIPKSLQKINDFAFHNTALKDIDFGKNENFICENGVIYSKDKTVLYEALKTADLSSFVCPESVTSIKGGAFWGHSEMKSFKINDGIKKIERATFFGCKGLTEITLPSSVVAIDSIPFVESGIKKVYIPKQTYNIDKAAFLKSEDKITIVTPKGSKAAKFAEENKIKTELV